MKAEEWINFNKWIFGIYAAGNVSSHATHAWEANGAKSPFEMISGQGQIPYQMDPQQQFQMNQMLMRQQMMQQHQMQQQPPDMCQVQLPRVQNF